MFVCAVALLNQAADELAAVDHGGLDARSRCDAIVDVRRALDRLECQWLAMVREADRRDDAPVVGAFNMAAVLRDQASMSRGAAGQAVGLARKLQHLPRTAAAFAAGEISAQHVAVIAQAFTPKRQEALAELEATFVAQAGTMNPEDLRAAIKYATDAIDGDGGAEEFMDLFEQRRFDIAQTLNGTVVGSFVLDPHAGEVALTVINWLYRADASDQTGEHERPRTPTQRRADAFRTMCGIVAQSPELATVGTTGRRHPPHVSVVVDVDVLARRAGADLVATVRAEVANLGRLSAETLRRIGCDACVSRIITDGPSQILDVGRATRTISSAMWRALVVRDRHCTFPGCDRGPGFCEAHHINHWEDGGETNLDNLQLLCWRHHIAAHEGTHTNHRKPAA